MLVGQLRVGSSLQNALEGVLITGLGMSWLARRPPPDRWEYSNTYRPFS
jgi:hypothetical protein